MEKCLVHLQHFESRKACMYTKCQKKLRHLLSSQWYETSKNESKHYIFSHDLFQNWLHSHQLKQCIFYFHSVYSMVIKYKNQCSLSNTSFTRCFKTENISPRLFSILFANLSFQWWFLPLHSYGIVQNHMYFKTWCLICQVMESIFRLTALSFLPKLQFHFSP